MNTILRLFGITGFIIFALGFGLTFGVPGFVESKAKDFIKERIQEKTEEKIEQLDFTSGEGKLAQMASKLLKSKQAEIDKVKTHLNSNIYEKIDSVIDQMSDLSWACREKYKSLVNSFKQSKINELLSLEKANAKLEDFMRGQYMQVTNQLKTDFRIFTGGNALIFLLLVIISFLKPHAVKHLFLPGILLFVSTIICAYFYLFQQNWFFTIIYNSYIGYAYLAYLGVVFLFLSDIFINKGHISRFIILALFNAVGATLSLASC